MKHYRLLCSCLFTLVLIVLATMLMQRGKVTANFPDECNIVQLGGEQNQVWIQGAAHPCHDIYCGAMASFPGDPPWNLDASGRMECWLSKSFDMSGRPLWELVGEKHFTFFSTGVAESWDVMVVDPLDNTYLWRVDVYYLGTMGQPDEILICSDSETFSVLEFPNPMP